MTIMTKELEWYGDYNVPNKTPYSFWQSAAERYIFASNFVKDKVVLDVACGVGFGTSYLARKSAQIIGGDISKQAIEYASMHYKTNTGNINFHILDALNLPFSDESFDAVVSIETIEHIKEYKRFISECSRVIKGGGVFICSTPNRKITSPLSIRAPYKFHVHEFYEEEFRKALREQFSSVALYGQCYKSGRQIKSIFRNIGRVILSFLPKSNTVAAFVQTRLLGDYIVKSGLEIGDTSPDRKYEVLPRDEDNSSDIPTTMVAIAYK